MKQSKDKIVLLLPPFWSPLIPPIGPACLKSYLEKHGYQVKTIDANTEIDFTDCYDKYFGILRQNVPVNKRGNFFSVGHDILRNHMTAWLNAGVNGDDAERFNRLVHILVQKTYYIDIHREEALKLNQVVEDIYARLDDYMQTLLEREKPGILGITVFSDTLPAAMFCFKKTREFHPHVKTVMGGAVFADQLNIGSENLDIFMKKTESYIDKIFVGEGEILFLKWLQGQLPEDQRLYTMNDINREILDLSEVGVLDMTDFDCRNYAFVVSYTSRSCPFQCSFCSETVQWGRYRKKHPQKIFNELHTLYQRHGEQLFLLSDSLLNPVVQDLSQHFLKTGLVLYWGGWLRVDNHTCDIDKTLQWRRGGFYQARLGLESGSENVLRLMGKHITLDQVRTSVANLANVGIKTTTLWIVGHPGETEEDFQMTLDLIEEMKNDIYEAECRPFYFYLTGQSASESDWWANTGKQPLYPEEMQDMLMLKTWILDAEPRREVIYERMNRFVAHCRDLGIPNPYSRHDIYQADQRWNKLHKNAVPPVMELKNTNSYTDECKRVQKLNTVKIEKADEEYSDFGF